MNPAAIALAIKPYTKYIVMGVLALVVFFLLKRYVFGKKPKKEEVESDVSVGSGGKWITNGIGAKVAGFDPTPITDAIKSDIYGTGFRNTEAYNTALTLSNAELTMVYNDWNDRYYKKDKESLTQAIQGEFSLLTYASEPMKLLANKLISIGLT